MMRQTTTTGVNNLKASVTTQTYNVAFLSRLITDHRR